MIVLAVAEEQNVLDVTPDVTSESEGEAIGNCQIVRVLV